MKKIMVCVKEVPNNDRIEIDYEKGVLKRSGVQSILNPNDELAVYWALKLKQQSGFHITVLSMGPMQALKTVDYLLALGLTTVI